MKKSFAAFTILVLICAFVCSGLLATDVCAAASDAENETVYAATDVNLRAGPGTNYEKITVLPHGASAVRTDTGSDGWSKVIYNGSEGYVRSKYLSGAKTGEVQKSQTHLLETYDDSSAVFEPVNQDVYATTDVNVRIGPGTQYQSLGSCTYGESIHRIGVGTNGWSKVIYQDKTAYIRSKYLSTTRGGTADSEAVNLQEHYYGRLTIPDVGIDVGLYYCSSAAEYASLQQSIVDADDSAAYLDQAFIKGAIIADHNFQGFSQIRSCVPHETRAYIDLGSHSQAYICIGIGPGTNTGSDLQDWDKNSLNYGSIPGGLAMYTCNENWNNITITYWEPY